MGEGQPELESAVRAEEDEEEKEGRRRKEGQERTYIVW